MSPLRLLLLRKLHERSERTYRNVLAKWGIDSPQAHAARRHIDVIREERARLEGNHKVR